MSEYDLHSNIKTEIALETQPIFMDTTTIGEIIDTKGFESIEYIIQAIAITDASVFNIVLEEGDDAGLSDSTVLDSELVLGDLPVFTTSSEEGVLRVGSIGKDRFQRLSIVSGEVGAGSVFSAIAILGNPHVAPVLVPELPIPGP